MFNRWNNLWLHGLMMLTAGWRTAQIRRLFWPSSHGSPITKDTWHGTALRKTRRTIENYKKTEHILGFDRGSGLNKLNFAMWSALKCIEVTYVVNCCYVNKLNWNLNPFTVLNLVKCLRRNSRSHIVGVWPQEGCWPQLFELLVFISWKTISKIMNEIERLMTFHGKLFSTKPCYLFKYKKQP